MNAPLNAHQYEPVLTFPSATADVAMSRTKLSPSLAGAATLMGLVPKVHYKEQVHSVRMRQRSRSWHEVQFILRNKFTSLPRVGTTSGDVLVNDMPCGGQIIRHTFKTMWAHSTSKKINDIYSIQIFHSQSCSPSELAMRSILQYHNGWSLRKKSV